MNHYEAEAARDGRFWFVTVTGPSDFHQVTQARRLTEIMPMVNDLIRVMTGETEGQVKLAVRLDRDVEGMIANARQATEQLAELQERVGQSSRTVARRLREEGLSGVEIAQVLEVSPQRVSQLLASC